MFAIEHATPLVGPFFGACRNIRFAAGHLRKTWAPFRGPVQANGRCLYELDSCTDA
jgi:hypothetical protein